MPMLRNATSEGRACPSGPRGASPRPRCEERAMEQNTSPLGLTKPPDEQHSGAERLLQLVSFKIGNEEFGLDILRVQEIVRLQDLTRVPNSPDFIDGVINLRGKVIPIIALRKRFGLQQQEYDKQPASWCWKFKTWCWASSLTRYQRSCGFRPAPSPRRASARSSVSSSPAW